MADRSDIPTLEDEARTPTRRAPGALASRIPSRAARRTAPKTVAPAAAVRTARTRRRTGPFRTLAISAIVAGLVATVALPAYGALRPVIESQTLQQVSAADAQTLVVASEAQAPAALDRGDYAATTPEEIAATQAAAAAAAAAAARAQAVAANSSALASVDLSMVSPGSGAVRWPLDPGSISFMGDGFLSRGGAHQGQDMLAAGGTPIFAAAAGVVDVSQESYGGYGVAVTISSVVGGQTVYTTYGHMTYGSRVVSAGDTVAPGQLIGLVGSTGSSTANHLHFEVNINGSNVDPVAWLYANAG